MIFFRRGIFTGILVVISSGLLYAWQLPECTGKRCPTFASEQEYHLFRTYWKTNNIIQLGINRFIHAEARYPTSYSELCDSPHIAVRCQELINPYTGQPVTIKENSPGDILWEYRDGNLFVTYQWVQNGALHKPSPPERGSYSPTMEDTLKRLEKQEGLTVYEQEKNLSFAEKAATAVGGYLDLNILVLVRYNNGYFPATFEEIIGLVEKVHPSQDRPFGVSDIVDFSRLRNEFTGGHATAVDTPSPGNFRYAQLEPGKMVLEIYGEGGRILKQYIYPNPVSIGPPGPGELVTVPPKKIR